MPVIPFKRVVDPKRIIGGNARAEEEEESHRGSMTTAAPPPPVKNNNKSTPGGRGGQRRTLRRGPTSSLRSSRPGSSPGTALWCTECGRSDPGVATKIIQMSEASYVQEFAPRGEFRDLGVSVHS
jgi:hypothetical protein